MVRKDWIKQIVETLLKNSRREYNKQDIESAIIECRGMDKRTINNWFDALFKLGYLEQPSFGKYSINITKAALLEIPLNTLTHTQTSLDGGVHIDE